MKIILVRHGETTANVGKLFCGHTDVALTEKGIHQAEEAAEKLNEYTFSKIYSSDLRRAYRTAAIINAYHNLPIHKEEGLREINFGDCEGYTYQQLVTMNPEAFKGKRMGEWTFKFPGGESLKVMTGRIMKTMDRIRGQMSEEDIVLIVVHAGVIRSILAMDIAKNPDAYWRFDIDNCGIVELNYFEEFCMISKLNG